MRKEDEIRSGQSAQYAAMDVKFRNKANTDLYSLEHKAWANDIRDLLDVAYQGATVYSPNFRAKFIAVKVEKPGGYRFRSEVKSLNASLEEQGVTIKKTAANSFVYQLPAEVS